MKIRCGRANVQKFLPYIGTFNARKFGKHRRGTVFLASVEWQDGWLEVRFNVGRRFRMPIREVRGNALVTRKTDAMYPLTDFRKLLKGLHASK